MTSSHSAYRKEKQERRQLVRRETHFLSHPSFLHKATCSWSPVLPLSPSPLCCGGISNAVALAVCIDCEFQLWRVESLVCRVQGRSSGGAGRNRHVQVYWNTLLILPVIALALLPPLFCFLLSIYLSTRSRSSSLILLLAPSFLLPGLSPTIFTALVTPSTSPISSFFLIKSVSLTFLCCFLTPFHLHYHSPPNLPSTFLFCHL